jgi:hypothetical protein
VEQSKTRNEHGSGTQIVVELLSSLIFKLGFSSIYHVYLLVETVLHCAFFIGSAVRGPG